MEIMLLDLEIPVVIMDHWHGRDVCRRFAGRKLRLGTRFRGAGQHAECVCPICLGDFQSGDAQTFLIVIDKGWHDPHFWTDQLAYLQVANAP